jgi:hypothetical protein
MKMLLSTLLFCVLAISCKKESKYKYSGTIAGYDYATCPCCGGYMIKIDGDNTSYRATSLPSGTLIDSTHFPIKVNLNYSPSGSCSSNHFITISSMIVVY